MTLDTLKAKLLADPEVKAEYDKIKPEFEAAKQIIQLRRELNMTQQQLADKAGIKQPQLARIETGKHSPRLATIFTIAASVGYTVELRIVPSEKEQDAVQHSEQI
jgi:transcriptional regulator with XRE-family HTH domain